MGALKLAGFVNPSEVEVGWRVHQHVGRTCGHCQTSLGD